MLLQIIRKWLKNLLGITLSVTPTYFVEAIRDGVLLGQILRVYGVISVEELHSLEETKDPAVAYDNYSKFIKEWLERIDFCITTDDIHEIINGEPGAAATLFYDLFLNLENRKDCTAKPKHRGFLVQKVPETTDDTQFFELNPLCEPLMRHWDVVNWERGRLDSLMKKYVDSRKEYNEYLEKKNITDLNEQARKLKLPDIPLPVERRGRSNYTYEELIAQQKLALAMHPFEPNLNEAKRILHQIKSRKKDKSDRTAFRLEMQHQLMAEVWQKIAETEEDDFDKIVCQKLMEQSVHEKQIAEKLLNIRKQKDVMIRNREIQDELDRKKRDEEFVRKLFEESLEDQMQFHDERMAKINEHNFLYQEKLTQKALKHEKICQDALNDIADLALKEVEYKKLYGVNPDPYTKRTWATLFVKGQPIFDEMLPADLKQTHHEDCTQELEAIYYQELHRQDAVNSEVFEDYIHFQNIWSIGEELAEFTTVMQLGMNCLGYVVHRLLLKKYPLPVPEKPNFSQEIEFSVCATNVTDLTRLDFLQRLLQLRGVKVIQMTDATDFCIKAYEKELKTEYDEPFPEEEYLRELEPTKKDKGEKAGKKGKGSGKDSKGSKEQNQSKKEKAGKNKDGKKGKASKNDKVDEQQEDVKPILEDKEVQAPRLFPWEKIVFSKKAKLGRAAKQILGEGGELENELLVEMFVEYLLSMTDIKGWVLLNFPCNYVQAALLEQALTGKPVPKKYFDKTLNKESLESVEINEQDMATLSTGTQEAPLSNETLENMTAYPESEQENFKEGEDHINDPGSIGTNPFSMISLTDDWNVTSEHRITQLLPDLKHLAFFTEEEKTEIKSEEPKPCNCICLPRDNIKKIDALPPKPKNPCVFDLIDPLVCRLPVEYTGCRDGKTGGVNECTCLDNDFSEKNEQGVSAVVDQQEQNVQTDILALQEDADDNLVKSSVAEDYYEQLRLSKILPNPRPIEKEEYSTCLTAYITMKLKQPDENGDYPIPWYEELEKKSGLEIFYLDQGCYYILEYEEFTADTVKCLAKTVIGDYSLPYKTSIEIFGERYKEALLEDGDHTISKKGKEKKKDKDKKKKKKEEKSDTKVKDKNKDKGAKGKKGKDNKSKGSSKSSKGKKGKKTEEDVKPEVTYDEKEVQVPTIESVEELALPEPRAGEEDWEYVNLELPSDIEVSLGNFWYTFEEKYKENFKEMIFNKRVLLDEIIPFLAKTRNGMTEFIQRSDQKQFYLREFQKTLNEIDLDLRSDSETKYELLCRIDEFREKLLGICDVKMRESEEERRNLVRQNWLFHKFCELTNNVSIAYQLEIDRLIDTIQILSDYYTAIITKSTQEGYDFHKEILPKYNCDDSKSEAFNDLFIVVDGEHNEDTEFHKYIENSKDVALAFVESMKPLALKPVTTMKTIFAPKEKEKKTKKKKEKSFEPEEEVKENAEKIFEEWECAIDGEFARMVIHLNVIRNEAFSRVNNVISWIKRIFRQIFDDISLRYENELASVQKACEILMESVEHEEIIRPELCFENDKLAEIQITLFPDSQAISPEDYTEGTFKITQLDQMVRILMDLAKSGYIMKKTFVLLITDMLYQDEEEATVETPQLWRNLSSHELDALLKRIFDDENYLYWKNFIVCNMMIPFPTSEKLMDVRKQFRQYDNELTELVTKEEFETITFWFEGMEEVDVSRVKSMIFRMYQTDESNFNYTAMLLDFCKDEDQILGFVKALELSLGKFICYDEAAGAEFVIKMLEDRMLFDQKLQEHDETITLAKKAVSMLIDKIVDEESESFQLQEVEENSTSSSEYDNGTEKSGGNNSKILSEGKFSFTEIGFEARDNTELCYFLPLELILIIVDIEVSWSSKADTLESPSFKEQVIEIYAECRNSNFNNAVLAHEFLHNERFVALLKKTNMFLAHNPVRLVKQILRDETETFGDEEVSSLESVESETTEDY